MGGETYRLVTTPVGRTASTGSHLARQARRLVWLPAVVALAVLFVAFYQPFWLLRVVQRLLPGALFYVCTREPLVALTFDDGPDSSVTPAVLAILRRERVPATWFIMGERAARYPALHRAIVAEGHEVGNHFWSEVPTWRMDVARFRRDLLRTEALIQQRARPRLMRPASGWIRPWGFRESRALGYSIVLGSAYVSDPARPPRAYMRWALVRMARPGAIIVLHVGPGRERTPEVLPEVIRDIRAKGLRFVTVSQLASRRSRESPAATREASPHRPL